MLKGHYWVGSFCNFCTSNNLLTEPVIAISDTITLVHDFGNKIPNKSWFLYLLELFNKDGIPSELNLICQFDDQNYFEAIFNGINQYRFKKILPNISNSYRRFIIFNKREKKIGFHLLDLMNEKKEQYELELDKYDFSYFGYRAFTGIEWWNIGSINPYEIRFKTKISDLLYGIPDNLKYPDSIIFKPFSYLSQNNDGLCTVYPVSFTNVCVADGCLSYCTDRGICSSGMTYIKS